MSAIGYPFILSSGIASSRLEKVTRSISPEVSARAKHYMIQNGFTIVGENSRKHVMGRGPDTFCKSMTPDSAHRLENFYPLLERAALSAGFVPILLAIDCIDDEVSIAYFEYVHGEGGTARDTADCLNIYAALQESAARYGADSTRVLIDACHNEVSTWSEELLQSWDPVHWTDPKILHWAGTDARAMIEVGLPALRSVASLLTALSPEGICAPVHADLYVGNYLRTSTNQAVIFDWDEGYWGLPGMGLQILVREAMDNGIGGLDYKDLLELAPAWVEMGISESDLAVRTLASAVIEIAGVRQSLTEWRRPRARHAAYLAAWACRYEWVIKRAQLC
ncbi:phosphotransferase [Nocardia exalbida]|uniref:phosphotransferase n=1 Tax=Nocardia exalbida TaxID=290231 RepID=UPI0012F64989|nr:phosphotransferase [Nocardia exalbida]